MAGILLARTTSDIQKSLMYIDSPVFIIILSIKSNSDKIL